MRIMNPRGIPLPTVRRLPFYQRLFKEESEKGTMWVSSDFLGDRLGLGAIQVRKDLAMIGAEGRARCGFPVAETTEILSRFLGSEDYADVFLIGSGVLAEAILADATLATHGFRVIAVFDPDPARAGGQCGDHDILPITKLSDLVRRMGVKIAVFAETDKTLALIACAAVKASALHGLFDVSGLSLEFPEGLHVERDDFGSRLAKLAGELGAKRILTEK
jgi:redox-sensing transcriptional repressor